MHVYLVEQDHLVAGLRDLRSASKLLLVASILGILVSVMILSAVPALLSISLTAHTSIQGLTSRLIAWLPLLIIGALLGLVAGVISLYAIYAKLLPSSKHLAKWRPSVFDTPRKLLYIGYWGALAAGVLAFIAAVALAAGALPALMQASRAEGLVGLVALLMIPLILVFLAGILSFVGEVGMIMLFYELGGALQSERFKHVALLTVAYILGGVLVSLIPNPAAMLPGLVVIAGLQAVAFYLAMEECTRILSSALQQPPAGV